MSLLLLFRPQPITGTGGITLSMSNFALTGTETFINPLEITLGQAAVATNSGSTQVTTQTATYGSAVRAGSLLVAVVGTVGSTNVTGVSDNVNGAWTLHGAY